jgi:acid phosphatase class B
MTRFVPRLRRSRGLPLAASAVAALSAVLMVVSGSAGANVANAPVPPPPPVPTSANQIQNIDQVKTAIKGYYGDTTTAQVDPVDNAIDGGDKILHTFSPTSSYANEMAGIVTKAENYLLRPLGHNQAQPGVTGQKAVLFDIDDTTLNTYNYEIYSNFVYNPTTNAAFVNAAIFPAVPGMVGLEKFAKDNGYTVFFLTGRPESQRAGTLTNLVNEGYDVNPANVFLKDLTSPILSFCAPTCSTVQYKSAYRGYIQSQGYEIYANFGDQFSDLNGGNADKTFKIPNPMYYLP